MTEFTTNCVACGKPIVGKRSTKRYCNNRCKQANKNKRYGRIRPETETSIIIDALVNLNRCDDRELIRHGRAVDTITKELQILINRINAIDENTILSKKWKCQVCLNIVTGDDKPTKCHMCKSRGFEPI